jgi:hypothetical protein
LELIQNGLDQLKRRRLHSNRLLRLLMTNTVPI